MNKPVFRVKVKEKSANYAAISLSPLESGYGLTLGNALRRVLLVALSGSAITQVKIKSVRHQYSTLPGLKEDIVDFCLNLKRVRFKVKRGQGPFKALLELSGPGQIKAGDIKTPAEIEVVNKDLVLGNLATKKNQIQVNLEIETGFGYQPVEQRERKTGFIPLDAIFSPVLRVGYEVKSTRVGQRTNLDELVMKITTDGSLNPQSALEEAAKILVDHFHHIYEPVFEKEKEEPGEKTGEEIKKLSLEEIDLPTRIANALVKAGFKTIGDLLRADRKEVIKVKNFGEKSFQVLVKKLKKKGVDLETSR